MTEVDLGTAVVPLLSKRTRRENARLFAIFRDPDASDAEREQRARRAGPPPPAAGRALRAPLPQPRRAVRGPGPGRHDRPDQVRRPVRHRPRRGVLHLRDAHDHRRDQALLPRQGLGDPRARAGCRSCGCRSARPPRSSPSRSAAPPRPRELAEAIGCSVEEIVEGMESSNAYATLSLDATDDSDDGGQSMLDAIGIDDEALEQVEIRESVKPLLESLPPREKTDPAAALLQEHDAVADRRRDRRLPDARVAAAHPHARPAAASRWSRGLTDLQLPVGSSPVSASIESGCSTPASTTTATTATRDRGARRARGCSRPARARSAG